MILNWKIGLNESDSVYFTNDVYDTIEEMLPCNIRRYQNLKLVATEILAMLANWLKLQK